MVRTSAPRIADSGRFQFFILGVILANAIMLGLQTYDAIEHDAGDLLTTLDDVFLGDLRGRADHPDPRVRPAGRDFFRTAGTSSTSS